MGIEMTVKSLEEVVKVIIPIINYPPSFPSNSKYIALTTSSKPNSYRRQYSRSGLGS